MSNQTNVTVLLLPFLVLAAVGFDFSLVLHIAAWCGTVPSFNRCLNYLLGSS